MTKEYAEYSEALADAICAEIATGSSVRPAAELHGVSERAFYLWLTKHDYLVQNYTRAREIRADARFESSADLMMDLRTDVIDAAKARIMLDEIKWKCGKESAKKYGDKLALGGDGSGEPIKMDTTIQIELVRPS